VRAAYNTVPQPQNKFMSNIVKPPQALDSKRKARAKIGHFLLKIHATHVKLYTTQTKLIPTGIKTTTQLQPIGTR
jgi:hypothetical protein